MSGYTPIARFVSISLILLFAFAGLRVTPPVRAQGAAVEITKVTHYAGNTDVYTNKKNTCIKIKRKDTGETWTGTTDDLGRLVINTGTVVSKENLEASEVNNCPEVNSQSVDPLALIGVVTVAFETKQGQVKLNLPADMRAGDTISGTVYEYDARGNVVRTDDAGRASDRLEGAVIDINGQQHRLRDRILTFAVAGGSTLPIILRDRSGREIERSQVLINQNTTSIVPSRPGGDRPIVPPRSNNFPPTPLGNFQPPRIGQIGRELTIPGSFDGQANTTKVLIGNQPAEFLAESPRSTFVRVPKDIPAAPTMLTVEEVFNVQGRSEPRTVSQRFKFNPVSVELSADKLHLVRGEGTTLRITLRGLELDDYEQLLLLELENLSPQTVHFTSKEVEQNRRSESSRQPGAQSEVLRKSIKPSEARNGIITLEEALRGINAGGFTITATLYAANMGWCPDECKLSDPNKNRTVEVDFVFVKYNEGQSQPIYDVKVRVCCDICLQRTCFVYWTQNKWENHCTPWKTLFQVMKTEAANWENMTNPGTNYKDEAAIKGDAEKRAATINCPIVL